MGSSSAATPSGADADVQRRGLLGGVAQLAQARRGHLLEVGPPQRRGADRDRLGPDPVAARIGVADQEPGVHQVAEQPGRRALVQARGLGRVHQPERLGAQRSFSVRTALWLTSTSLAI
jgi:hypothetical protein